MRDTEKCNTTHAPSAGLSCILYSKQTIMRSLKLLTIMICKYKGLTPEFYEQYSFRAKSHFEGLFV